MPDILDLSKFEEQIYNTHLKASRTHKGLPFRYRKDFSSLDDKTKSNLKKISLFLTKHKHINLDEYINAPYKVYQDEDFFDLEYYITLKAVKAYSLYYRQLLNESPDSTAQLHYIVRSLKFIQDFCRDKAIQLPAYLKHTEDKTPSFLLHLKDHKVNIYTLLGFKNFIKELKSNDIELIRFIVGDELIDRVDLCNNKLLLSKKARELIMKGFNKIERNLKK